MAHSSPVRWLAPLALGVTCLAVVLVFAGSLGSSSTPPGPDVSTPATQPSTPARAGTPASTTTTTTTSTSPASTPATYTVQAGDYLSTVAERTGLSVERLRELNPGLDANSMHVGQKIQLEPAKP
jgi:LysM repeat protein